MGKITGSLSTTFRAFKYRNYRLFFTGQGLSLIGTWIQMIATGWLVYRLTGSPFMLGAVGFASQLPGFILGPFTGALCDRWDKYKILLATQTVEMAQALLLALLVFTGHATIWYILFLNLILGLAGAFESPARQAFVIDMVDDKKDLGNAIALNSAMFNGARLIGPSIAGLAIAAFGEGICFLLNGISFLAVLAALLMMRLPKRKQQPSGKHLFKEILDGIFYTYGSVPIRSILTLLGITSLVGMPYAMIMPVYVKDVLDGGPEMLGFLMAASGIGSLLGAFFLAGRKTSYGIGRIVPASAGFFGFGLLCFSLSENFFLSFIVLLVVGFGMMLQMASSNTFIQSVVEDRMRGRVMSLFAMAFLGMGMFGNLLVGSIVNYIGVQKTMLLSGLISIGAAAVFALMLPAIKEKTVPVKTMNEGLYSDIT